MYVKIIAKVALLYKSAYRSVKMKSVAKDGTTILDNFIIYYARFEFIRILSVI